MDDRTEIVFFDLETSVPTRSGQGYAILEFGAILVCPRKLVELESYSTLVCPSDPSLISSLSIRANGISRDAVLSASTFLDISDKVYDLLDGRIWAGHNILRFDCARIREAFAEIGKTAPEPKGTIDSLALLTQKFGRRAGDMKMASIANYFGLGKQSHRSLDDVRMNLEVLKYCATVLFLESSLPDIFTKNSWVSPNATTRSHSNGNKSANETSPIKKFPSLSVKLGNSLSSSPTDKKTSENHSIQDESNLARPDPFNFSQLINEISTESLQSQLDVTVEENPVLTPHANSDRFLALDEVSITSISVSLVPFYRGFKKIKICHQDVVLQLCSNNLRVKFGISTKFVDYAGRPRLNFVADASPSLCRVLDACDDLAMKLSIDSGSSSEWRPVVMKKNGFLNSPTVRFNIPTVVFGEVAMYATEIYHKKSSSALQKLVFSKIDAAELVALFIPGTCVDAYFSLDTYDYQQSAGIRLVAKKLIIHSTL